MFSHLKLSTFSWVIAIMMAFSAGMIVASAFLVEKKIVVINDTWELYQTDLSEKPRLESVLRGAMGYGGMIHDFKNYILRGDEKYRDRAISGLGAAIATLKQYKALQLTNAETIAIEDIFTVFDAYKKAIQKTQLMIAQGQSINNIDQNVKVNDQPAIRGLKVLRHEVLAMKKNTSQFSKSRLIADLRAALGYNGMIHKFKNYILRHQQIHGNELKETKLTDEIKEKINVAQESIQQYRKLTPTEAEKLALSDIESTLTRYLMHITNIHSLIKQHQSIKGIDQVIKVDDVPALRGLKMLDREINTQLASRSNDVTKALEVVNKVILLGKSASIFTILFIMIITILLIRFTVIQPIHKLTIAMMQLANNNLDTEITGHQAQNEIGQMARAVMIFKANMKKQKESELAFAESNKGLQQQLIENKQLRQQSEQQTNKALLMSEYMVEARNASEKAMAKAEKDELFVSSILNAVRDGIITISPEGIIEAFNPGAEDIFGYKRFEVIGKNISMLMPETETDKNKHNDYLERFAKGESTRDQTKALEQTAQRKNGDTFPVEISLNTASFADGIKITGVVRDVTERKKWENQINRLAMTDPLTGLANRNQYEQRLQEAVKHAKRLKNNFALILIDLDKFKPVNDTYGHPVGDVLLQLVAGILLASCREVDTVARLGGDEFAIIINGINELENAAIPANKLIDKLSKPLQIEENNIQIGASMGISSYPNDSTDLEDLQRMADQALYLAKEEGRNTYRFYSNIAKQPA